MSELEQLAERLQNNLNSNTRTALLAECGNRALPIYERSWIDVHHPEVARSIEIGWDFACNKNIYRDEFLRCQEKVTDTLLFYLEEGHSLLSSSVLVVKYIIESIEESNEQSGMVAARGIYATEFLARSVENDTNTESPLSPQKDIAEAEEMEWLEKAIRIAENWKSEEVNTHMFDSITDQEPTWLTDWKKNNKPEDE